ncbi:MAG: class I SAM-dependent methyltransferase [Peptococcaceae bacterium]|nr:class I SAM-dependent methyltransferase [Peptococcaceae bacterium]
MLSKRLETVAQLVPAGTRMADIGCDHGYLPLALVNRGQVTHAICCDVNAGPLAGARENARRLGSDVAKLNFRLGDGLSVLAPGEVDVVTLAGMGAGLMRDILDAAPAVVEGLSMIVTSPNVAPWILRQWAMDHAFAVASETVIFEGGHFYEVMALVPADAPVQYSPFDLYFGVQLPAQEDAVAAAYFAHRRQHDKRLLDAWAAVRAKRADVAERYDALTALWKEWEEHHAG